jgi:hypothetical protein
MRNGIIFLAILIFPASVAIANPKASTTCAAGLPAPARQIYDAVLAAEVPVTDLEQMVREQTMALVQSGEIQMATAPDSALAAARCLELQR